MSSLYLIAQKTSLVLIALMFIAAGVLHFAQPNVFTKIVPPYLPAPLELVYLSGVFELLGGVGILMPKFRRLAGWGLIALLIAVFPANIQMLIQANDYPSIPYWTLVARLPMQFALIAWVWWVACSRDA